MNEPTCDWCELPATHITRHERKNTGTFTVYWCDKHYAIAVRPAAAGREQATD